MEDAGHLRQKDPTGHGKRATTVFDVLSHILRIYMLVLGWPFQTAEGTRCALTLVIYNFYAMAAMLLGLGGLDRTQGVRACIHADFICVCKLLSLGKKAIYHMIHRNIHMY